MKIELNKPFSDDYIAGYLLQNKEPRNLVLLVKEDRSQTSVSYARYLMSCYLERYLDKNEHVDHIDNDKLNDVIENLQILTPLENIRKSKYKGIFYDFICPICSTSFKLTKQRMYGKVNPTCSRKCGYVKTKIK